MTIQNSSALNIHIRLSEISISSCCFEFCLLHATNLLMINKHLNFVCPYSNKYFVSSPLVPLDPIPVSWDSFEFELDFLWLKVKKWPNLKTSEFRCWFFASKFDYITDSGSLTSLCWLALHAVASFFAAYNQPNENVQIDTHLNIFDHFICLFWIPLHIQYL